MRRLLGAASTGLASAALALAAAATATPAAASRAVPVVAPGQALPVAVGGFAGNRPVVVQLVGSRTGHRVVRADRFGRVHLSYRVPTADGRYRLLVSGPSRATQVRGVPPVVAAPSGDAQVIAVTVPLVVGVPFQVGGSGVDAGGLHNGPSGHRPSGSGALATTGSDLRELLVFGAALCLLGLAALLAGRRRARP